MAKAMIRQGGRSARIQEAVHKACGELLKRHERSALTVPMIAERAGVTPSTIYRRWGDLDELLADIAAARMRPQGEPLDTGSQAGDIEAWTLQYAEEMSTPVGRDLLNDLFVRSSDNPYPGRCCEFTYQQLSVLRDRAIARGEAPFDMDELIDRVVAPMVYHILFGDRQLTPPYCLNLIAAVVSLRQGSVPQ